LIVQIPMGYTPVDLPQGTATDERFGYWSMKTSQHENTILCIRNFELKKNRHVPDVYADFYDFMHKISLADAQLLVLEKTE
ncbi:MAG: DUF3858 domain-containing protein, partial [Lentimicrobiaceae bacterium]|nr:DUF3858 domain-containing protein [Lentimicrobiaceae bacterium]